MRKKIFFLSFLFTVFFNLNVIKVPTSLFLTNSIYAPFLYVKNLIILLTQTEETSIITQAENQYLKGILNSIGQKSPSGAIARESFSEGEVMQYSPLGIPEEIIVKAHLESSTDYIASVVTDARGALVGRVLKRTGPFAIIPTIYNSEFKVGVECKNRYYTGIYKGGADPKVFFVPYDAPVSIGDTLITSTLSGFALPGIPVARVIEIKKDPYNPIFLTLRVEPFFKPFTSRKVIIYGTRK
jgi:hypothetical protein